jgi:hypothetical protein
LQAGGHRFDPVRLHLTDRRRIILPGSRQGRLLREDPRHVGHKDDPKAYGLRLVPAFVVAHGEEEERHAWPSREYPFVGMTGQMRVVKSERGPFRSVYLNGLSSLSCVPSSLTECKILGSAIQIGSASVEAMWVSGSEDKLSSNEGHLVDALAPRGDEGRGTLR